MALKKGISYKWRVFMPVLACFWTVILAMALWHVYCARSLKQEEAFDQLMLVGERTASCYNDNSLHTVEYFTQFISKFYNARDDYEMMGIIVTDPDGEVKYSIGNIMPVDLSSIDENPDRKTVHPVPDKTAYQGIAHYTGEQLDGTDKEYKFLYYVTNTNDGYNVYTIVPYTRKVRQVISDDTTKFWLIFFSIALFGTIFVYISSSLFGKNIRVLRDFANQAAENPDFVSKNFDNLPHDEFGEISRKIITLYNQRVEEMEKREREHLVALHAIKEKERMKRDLTSNINHELKTPVGVIQGYIDTLIDNPDMDAETRDRFLYKTQASVHRLTSLIADITAITKLESGGKLINVSPINFHDLIFTFESTFAESGLLKGKLKFCYNVPLDCMVLGSDSLIISVVTNLVKNAVAYSKGTMCCLELIDEDDKFYKFRFYDDGVGVAPEHLPHMFERFFRVNQSRSRDSGGTGLGLAIVQVTINSLGGDIEVSNHYPHGLEFIFTLPKSHARPRRQVEEE